MHWKRNFIVILIFVVYLVTAAVPVFAASSPIRVFINGSQVFFDVPPMRVNDRTLVPLREIFEGLGAHVTYNEVSRTITSVRESTEVRLALGDRNAFVNGSMIVLDVPALSVSGRTFVPLRFIGEAFGADVRWTGRSRTVIITDSHQPSAMTADSAGGDSSLVIDTPDLPSGTVALDTGAKGYKTFGIVTQVYLSNVQPTITVKTKNDTVTFAVVPETEIFITELVSGLTNNGILAQVNPGDEAIVTTQNQPSTRALRLEIRYKLVRGYVQSATPKSGATPAKIYLKNGPVTDVNPAAAIKLNGNSVNFSAIVPGQWADMRVNPTTGETWNITLTQSRNPIPYAQQQVKIDSFEHDARGPQSPGSTVTFTLRGTAGGNAYFTIPGTAVRCPMQEQSPGIYTGSHTVTAADAPGKATPAGILEKTGMSSMTVHASQPVIIQVKRTGSSTSLPAPGITQPRSGAYLGRSVQVYGKATPGAVVNVKVELTYSTRQAGASVETLEKSVQADLNGRFHAPFSFMSRPSGSFYVIRAYQEDKMGRISPTVTVRTR